MADAPESTRAVVSLLVELSVALFLLLFLLFWKVNVLFLTLFNFRILSLVIRMFTQHSGDGIGLGHLDWVVIFLTLCLLGTAATFIGGFGVSAGPIVESMRALLFFFAASISTISRMYDNWWSVNF